MIRSYFTSAIRHLLKNRAYTSMNIFGLSVGLACFMLIALWVQQELSFDKFHTKADRIYRVAGKFQSESDNMEQAVTPVPLGPALLSDLPEIERVVRLDENDAVVKYNDKQFVEDWIVGADPSFFDIFDFKLLKGNPRTALSDPYSIVISERIARKYFGEKDPMGEALHIVLYDPGNGIDYKVTGVIEDCPENSHFKYSCIFSFNTIEVADPEITKAYQWFQNGYYTYFLLHEGADIRNVEAKLPQLLEKYVGERMRQRNIKYEYFVQPLDEIHLHSSLRYEIEPTNNFTFILIFSAIGFIVLVLACINYINLSTAYATERGKEVGIRKVLGAQRNQLMVQHLVESWLLAISAMVVSIAWIELAKPFFESITGSRLTNLYSVITFAAMFGIASFVGIASGLYPSLALSGFNIVRMMKGIYNGRQSAAWLRKVLVVVQYSITIVLITGILVVQLQFRFITEKDLGFDKNNLIVMRVNGSEEVFSAIEAFRNDLKSNSVVKGVATANSMIAGGLGNSVAVAEDMTGKMVSATMQRLRIDPEYINTYRMKILAGRNFLPGQRDTASFIINEAATRIFGYKKPEDAIGRKFHMNGMEGAVIGVVQDFHYNSLQHKVEPACMMMVHGQFSNIAIRIDASPSESIALATRYWKKYFPNSVIQFAFAEQRVASQYEAEQRFSKVFTAFSAISLVVACLGLFSLVSYAVERRTKEIGIRKVLGASVLIIVRMLSSEFMTLIAISCVIAIPIAHYFMSEWLETFVYHVSLTAIVYVIAIGTALTIAMLTIAMKAIRSAMANPVDALRTE